VLRTSGRLALIENTRPIQPPANDPTYHLCGYDRSSIAWIRPLRKVDRTPQTVLVIRAGADEPLISLQGVGGTSSKGPVRSRG